MTVSRLAGTLISGVLLILPAAKASLLYDITINTGALAGHPAAPFSIDFQFNDGSGLGDANNSVVLSNFLFGGGAVTGLPTLTGSANGSTANSISITDGFFLNEFTQAFTPGNKLSFRLSLTTNVDGVGVPDQFSFAILDSSGVALPTLSVFDVFVEIDVDSSNPAVQTFASDPSRAPAAGGSALAISAPTATAAQTAVPEPDSIALLASIFTAAYAFHARNRR